MNRRPSAGTTVVAGLAVLGATGFVYVRWLHVSNATTVSLTFLLIVLVVAAAGRFRAAAIVSVAAMLAINFFFLPPVGTFTIADPQNWIALFTFLAVSLVASNLSAAARARADEARARRDELARLFDLSRDVLMITDSRDAVPAVARAISRRFDLDAVAIALPGDPAWEIAQGGSEPVALDAAALSEALGGAGGALEFDARERTYTGHRLIDSGGRQVRLVPLRSGTRPIGLLAAAGRPIESGTLEALAGVVALAVERVQLLEERKLAELTRRSEEMKTMLLESLAHDLRTPLTTIRVAAGNLQASWLSEEHRRDQGDLIVGEVERLSRMFANILEMAKIDAGALESEVRWVHPSEIVSAAREQVEHTLKSHPIEVVIEPDTPVQLDPRITASALAHVLENAAQYSSPQSPIELRAAVAAGGIEIRVRDHGPGIADADLPHLFDRFYRGAGAKARAAGTGMGLSIAKGLLAAQHGRISARNCPDHGAEFVIVVPAASRADAPAREES
ncbi:MAG TPA: DUF4118 domain-containing protein [Vicinamibacterales bacterium]|nr:DUF4118 domain-containing protein [Vicinamibacterales bacterium]